MDKAIDPKGENVERSRQSYGAVNENRQQYIIDEVERQKSLHSIDKVEELAR